MSVSGWGRSTSRPAADPPGWRHAGAAAFGDGWRRRRFLLGAWPGRADRFAPGGPTEEPPPANPTLPVRRKRRHEHARSRGPEAPSGRGDPWSLRDMAVPALRRP